MRPYIAHDQAVASLTMYAQMVLFCLIAGCLLYFGLTYAFVRLYLDDPVPTLVEKSGMAVLVDTDDAPSIPYTAAWKYIVSFRVAKHLKISMNGQTPSEKEDVEPSLQRFFKQTTVSRATYLKGLDLMTENRMHRWKCVWFPASLLFFPFFFIAYFAFFGMTTAKKRSTKFIRGTDVVSVEYLVRKLTDRILLDRKSTSMEHLSFGGLPIPHDVERMHTLILGSTGTGKSVLLNGIIRSIIDRKRKQSLPHRLVIYDVKGEFIAKHYGEKDAIFYPFDNRSVRWSFFNEVENYPDLDILATSLYQPPKESRDTYWYNAARDVFRTGIYYLYSHNQRTNRDIWEFFSQSLGDIHKQLKTLPASEQGALKHIDKTDSNQAASVISILQERLTFFRYLQDQDGPFSFRKYIRGEQGTDRNLFLLNIRTHEAIFRPLMTYAIDIMIRELMSIPDDPDRRIFFVIDEFGSLAQLSSIFDFLTMARSKGGVLYLVNQDLGSVGDVYGDSKKSTFVNNFNSYISFRLNDPQTSEFLSKAFGERDVIKIMESRQNSPSDIGDRFSSTEQEKTEKVLLPTEFQVLENFHCFVKFSGFGISRHQIPKTFIEAQPGVTPFDERIIRIECPVVHEEEEGNVASEMIEEAEEVPSGSDDSGLKDEDPVIFSESDIHHRRL